MEQPENETAPRTPRRHMMLDDPARTLIVVLLAFLFACNALTLIAYRFLGQVGYVAPVVTVAVSATMIAWYQHRFRRSFDGLFGWSTAGMVLILPAASFMALNLVEIADAGPAGPALPCLGMALAAGISEEIVFRGILGSNLMRIRGQGKDILPNLLVTSFVFGAVHGGNILAGTPVSTTLFQMYHAFCMGMLFEAVLLRCGSLWPPIIMHTLIDFTGFLCTGIADGGIVSEVIVLDAVTIATTIVSSAILVFALFLARHSQRAGIVSLWDRKWHREG